ncbi:MAG: hypothetical protein IPM82_16020 [Saprospiraceae bacterium]|nr:hypothetical protein [Saprospiraceae bacterium]
MKKTTAILLFLALFAACQSGPDKTAMAESIKTLEKEVGASAQPPPDKVEALQNALVGYADAFQPTVCPASTYQRRAKRPGCSANSTRPSKFLENRKELSWQSGRRRHVHEGFYLDNDLKKLEEAKLAYEAFYKNTQTMSLRMMRSFAKNLGNRQRNIKF